MLREIVESNSYLVEKLSDDIWGLKIYYKFRGAGRVSSYHKKLTIEDLKDRLEEVLKKKFKIDKFKIDSMRVLETEETENGNGDPVTKFTITSIVHFGDSISGIFSDIHRVIDGETYFPTLGKEDKKIASEIKKKVKKTDVQVEYPGTQVSVTVFPFIFDPDEDEKIKNQIARYNNRR